MSTRAVTVLTVNGRRQNVKVEPNTTILEILEQVCQKYNFNAAEHDLKHHNKILDLSAMFRFSGLPNNALLEMVPVTKLRTEADVMLVVQLEDGSRLDGTFKPSASLLDVLKTVCQEKANAEANPVLIYMRKEVLWESMGKTTLKSLGLTGGRAIIRLLQRTPEELKVQANVSAPLPQKEKPEEEDMPAPRKIQQIPPKDEIKDNQIEADVVPEDKPKFPTDSKKAKPSEASTEPGPSVIKSTRTAGSEQKRVKTPEPVPEPPKPIINLLGIREAVLFHLETAERCVFDLPDSFYEITVSDVRKMYTDLRNKVKELEEAPLMTADLRQLEDSKRVLNHLARYKNAIIRVQFPDRYVLQGIFKPHEKVSDVVTFVRSYLNDKFVDFHLYTTPPKEILPVDITLVEAKCVPQVLLHFGCDAEMKTDKFLQASLYESKLSNATGASLVAARSRGQLDDEAPPPSSNSSETVSMETDTTEKQEDAGTSSGCRIPNNNFRPSSVQTAPSEVKLPKWLKPTGK